METSQLFRISPFKFPSAPVPQNAGGIIQPSPPTQAPWAPMEYASAFVYRGQSLVPLGVRFGASSQKTDPTDEIIGHVLKSFETEDQGVQAFPGVLDIGPKSPLVVALAKKLSGGFDNKYMHWGHLKDLIHTAQALVFALESALSPTPLQFDAPRPDFNQNNGWPTATEDVHGQSDPATSFHQIVQYVFSTWLPEQFKADAPFWRIRFQLELLKNYFKSLPQDERGKAPLLEATRQELKRSEQVTKPNPYQYFAAIVYYRSLKSDPGALPSPVTSQWISQMLGSKDAEKRLHALDKHYSEMQGYDSIYVKEVKYPWVSTSIPILTHWIQAPLPESDWKAATPKLMELLCERANHRALHYLSQVADEHLSGAEQTPDREALAQWQSDIPQVRQRLKTIEHREGAASFDGPLFDAISNVEGHSQVSPQRRAMVENHFLPLIPQRFLTVDSATETIQKAFELILTAPIADEPLAEILAWNAQHPKPARFPQEQGISAYLASLLAQLGASLSQHHPSPQIEEWNQAVYPLLGVQGQLLERAMASIQSNPWPHLTPAQHQDLMDFTRHIYPITPMADARLPRDLNRELFALFDHWIHTDGPGFSAAVGPTLERLKNQPSSPEVQGFFNSPMGIWLSQQAAHPQGESTLPAHLNDSINGLMAHYVPEEVTLKSFEARKTQYAQNPYPFSTEYATPEPKNQDELLAEHPRINSGIGALLQLQTFIRHGGLPLEVQQALVQKLAYHLHHPTAGLIDMFNTIRVDDEVSTPIKRQYEYYRYKAPLFGPQSPVVEPYPTRRTRFDNLETFFVDFVYNPAPLTQRAMRVAYQQFSDLKQKLSPQAGYYQELFKRGDLGPVSEQNPARRGFFKMLHGDFSEWESFIAHIDPYAFWPNIVDMLSINRYQPGYNTTLLPMVIDFIHRFPNPEDHYPSNYGYSLHQTEAYVVDQAADNPKEYRKPMVSSKGEEQLLPLVVKVAPTKLLNQSYILESEPHSIQHYFHRAGAQTALQKALPQLYKKALSYNPKDFFEYYVAEKFQKGNPTFTPPQDKGYRDFKRLARLVETNGQGNDIRRYVATTVKNDPRHALGKFLILLNTVPFIGYFVNSWQVSLNNVKEDKITAISGPEFLKIYNTHFQSVDDLKDLPNLQKRTERLFLIICLLRDGLIPYDPTLERALNSQLQRLIGSVQLPPDPTPETWRQLAEAMMFHQYVGPLKASWEGSPQKLKAIIETMIHSMMTRQNPFMLEVVNRDMRNINLSSQDGEALLKIAFTLDLMTPDELMDTIPFLLSHPKGLLVFSRFVQDIEYRRGATRNRPRPDPNEAEMMLMLRHPTAAQGTPSAFGAMSSGMTYLYRYTYNQVGQLPREALVNWADLGFLTHSFRYWVYDTRGGPNSLFAQFGFEPVEPRDSDTAFENGFYLDKAHRGDLSIRPETQIEFRRGYIAIQHPQDGILVIRNSSKVFGRDQLPVPALYRPTVIDHGSIQSLNLNDPEIRNSFTSVLDHTVSSAKGHNERVRRLLDELLVVKSAYGKWKLDLNDYEKLPNGKVGNFIGQYGAGFKAVLHFIHQIEFQRWMAGLQIKNAKHPDDVDKIRIPQLPDLAFVNGNYPIYEPMAFPKYELQEGQWVQTGTQTQLKLTPEVIEELQALADNEWIPSRFPNPTVVSFLNVGRRNAKNAAELVMLRPQTP